MEVALDALGYDMEKQLWLLLYSLILGAALGAVFDILRISRTFLSVKTENRAIKNVSDTFIFAVSFIEDILFFTVSAITLVLFCFQANRGNARGFILFGAAVGFFLYMQTVGRLTRLVSEAVAHFMWTVIGFTLRRIIMPIARAVSRLAGFVYRKTLGRAANAVRGKVRSMRALYRQRRKARLEARRASKTKGIRDEPGTFINTGKARNTPRVLVYDNYTCKRPNTLQQSGRGAGKVN